MFIGYFRPEIQIPRCILSLDSYVYPSSYMLKIGLHESRRPIYNIHVVNVDPITSLNVEYLEKLYSKIILSVSKKFIF